jgi:3'-5' exoribonuclease
MTLRELKTQAATASVTTSVAAQIQSLTSRTTKTGKDYLELHLIDALDHISLKLWSDTAAFAAASQMKERTGICATAEWSTNAYGLEAKNLVLEELGAEALSALFEGAGDLAARQQADFSHISAEVEAMSDPRLRALGQEFLSLYGDRFRRTAAARDYHHARRGGLVEHVAQMMRAARALASAYPRTNRDLLISGVLFHDVGKLWENSYAENGFTMPYDERGELLGHITIGIELVNQLWRRLLESSAAEAWTTLEPRSESVRLHLLHLIASHHGQLDFGSPVVPKTPEAFLLHYIDNIDAKLEMMSEGYATSAYLSPTIQEKRRPLSGNLVQPLPTFLADEPNVES